MKKRISVIILVLIVIFLLCACSGYNSGYDSEQSVKGEMQINGILECVEGNYICSEWRDTETGVHYFFYRAGGLEVRVNADGTPYTD